MAKTFELKYNLGMLRFGEDLKGLPVIDLSTGRRIAVTTDTLLDPDDLSVSALICDQRTRGSELLLLPDNIHEFSSQSITVQNEDALSPLEDLPRLDGLVRINYRLPGKKVRTESKRRLGIVTDFIIDDLSFKIMKLQARPPLTRIVQSSDLTISRMQIVEVNDKEVVVRDATVGDRQLVNAAVDA